ncbi:WD repeat-containing protein 63-like [Sinocyclocheilus rhinocerous]|uniref:WD repeat-containing protein 63-like n=1 Tax=Sinocyclocheilus rhinocerous TaxID=307959 RepID=UPI0007B79A66|nr:PREDICTED: WD repeat-containing protein 63-like [Sinocyclocheilus rhinocerous]
MSSKRPRSKEASKIKEKGHPDYIFPLVLTSATQELFGCREDEDVTGKKPYKLLKKEDIVQDMKTRASVSDFSPIKQLVLDYPEDELLLVFDRDFTYGQSFYLVLTVEAKENILKTDRQTDRDKSFSIREIERHTAIQASSDTKHSSTQTLCTQRTCGRSPEEKEHHLRSENLKNFITSVLIRFEISLQQNRITDVFCDDWTVLCEDNGALTQKTETQLKEYQSFMDLQFSKEKTISHIHWHPTISSVIAVAMTERLSLEERIDNSTKLLLNPSYILFWNFTDPINPQVVLWDISAHVERLQDTRSDGKNISDKLVSLPKIGSSGEYSPLKFSLRDNTVDYPTGDKPPQNAEREEGCGFVQLRVPSAKQQKTLENISTNLKVGTEDGELVYTDWKMEKDNDSGRLLSAKPIHRFLLHDTLVNTVSRSPFFKDIILMVGSFSRWKEGMQIVRKYFEKEEERLEYLEKRQIKHEKEKKEMEAEQKRKKTEPVMPLKQEEELEAEALKEYEQFLALEKVILKNMGLLTETEDRSDLDDTCMITSMKRRPIKGHLFQAANQKALLHIKGSSGRDWANRTSELQPNADRRSGCLSQRAGVAEDTHLR